MKRRVPIAAAVLICAFFLSASGTQQASEPAEVKADLEVRRWVAGLSSSPLSPVETLGTAGKDRSRDEPSSRRGASNDPVVQNAIALRWVDRPIEITYFPVTRAKPPEKKDKSYKSVLRASKRAGMRKVVTTFFNVHSKEALPVLDGLPPPAQMLDSFFKCRGFGTVRHLDDKLVETAIAAAVHFDSPRVEVISGYRSPKFNDSLAKKGRHVASESKHTRGAAMDFRLTAAPAAQVAKWLFKNFDGGVGVYVSDNFVHIDTGAERRWRGR
jgi:hypothetical protein